MSEINAIATNNYLLATQQEVSHDNTLSGNGTVDSPLGVASGTMNESAFEYSGGMITAYNGSAFKAGDEFPQSATEAIETVTANSADWNATTDTVSSNSGVWGGSALPISAGPGIKVNLVNNTLVFSNDETVLWENPNGTITKDIQWPQTLSEPITNFEKVSFLYGADDYSGNAEYHTFNTYNNFNYNLVAWRCDGPANNSIFWREAKFNCNGTSLTNPYNSTINLSTAFDGFGFNTDGYNWLVKVIGINRVSGGN